jgi:antitoxin component YwqK of YwqJK toxin-antitoxin module
MLNDLQTLVDKYVAHSYIVRYFKNGSKMFEFNRFGNHMYGAYYSWYENGMPNSIAHFKYGYYHGSTKIWDKFQWNCIRAPLKFGRIINVYHFKHGILVKI